MGDRISYIGLDVHKEGIVVAVAEYGLPHFMPTTRVWFDLRATRNGMNLSRSGARGYRSVTASGVRTRHQISRKATGLHDVAVSDARGKSRSFAHSGEIPSTPINTGDMAIARLARLGSGVRLPRPLHEINGL